MATLEKLRTRAGVLLAVIIGISLFAFILGDFLDSGGSLMNRSQLELAEISGKSISYQDFQGKVDEITEINKLFSGDNAIDEQTAERFREQIWQQIVRENVMDKEYEKLGVAVHPDELFDMIQGRNIHPIVQQLFGNPQTGEVNRATIIQFLKNLDADPSGRQKLYWLYVEKEINSDRYFTKYLNLVRKGMYVTSLQAKQSFADRDKKVDFSYVNLRFTSIPDSTITYSKSDLEKYYKEHEQDYQQTASRDIEYVIFPISPSNDDNKAAEEWINKVKDEFQNAEDPKLYVTQNSDSPLDSKNYKNGELPASINDWAFKAKKGEMIGPYFEDNSYKLARVAEILSLPDSVKARHILIAPKNKTQQDYNKAKTTADSLLKVLRKGGNFALIAKQFSADPGSANKGGDLGWFKEGVMEKSFNDACFQNKRGEIVLTETPYGFHIIEVLEKGKEAKKVQVAILERKVVASSKTEQVIYTEASSFAGNNTNYNLFKKAAEEKKLTPRIASNLLENDRKIAGLESPRELIRWAYKAKKGDVSSVFTLGNNFVVATLTEIREEGTSPLTQVKNDVALNVIKEKKAEILTKKMQDAIAGAKSIDEVAQKLGVNVDKANQVYFSSFSLPNAGIEPAVIATATSAPEGKMVGPVKGNSGIFALSVTAINKGELADVTTEKNRMMNSYRSRAYYEAFEALKKKAEIKDKRSKFY